MPRPQIVIENPILNTPFAGAGGEVAKGGDHQALGGDGAAVDPADGAVLEPAEGPVVASLDRIQHLAAHRLGSQEGEHAEGLLGGQS